ncbi:MAG: T9SS type A sorting domain-containing protein, partial [Candidatus Marinimicrobia bacterium]|nr:T9SS type A sorting domain-containing protein [Candidatus Neomarinimicrobiota bacterium]
EGTWTVVAYDEVDSTFAANGPFSLIIDASQVSVTDEINLPAEFALHANYPNPFNPITTLRYDLPENSFVNIIIYDLLGRQVKTLVNQTQEAGYRSVKWNATNDSGKPVSAGVYLYQIQAGKYLQTRKMILLK